MLHRDLSELLYSVLQLARAIGPPVHPFYDGQLATPLVAIIDFMFSHLFIIEGVLKAKLFCKS